LPALDGPSHGSGRTGLGPRTFEEKTPSVGV